MKKIDAFALRGFDEQKFLQRQLKACGLSSDRALIKPDGDADDFDDLLRTRRAYLQFADMLFRFRQRLVRHNDRLGRYQAALTRAIATASDDVYQNTIRPKSKRAVALSTQYAGIAQQIRNAENSATVMLEHVDIFQRNCCLKIFAARLREARKSLGLTQGALGKKIGVSTKMISFYEHAAREPSLATLKTLSQLSGRTTDWFLTQ